MFVTAYAFLASYQAYYLLRQDRQRAGRRFLTASIVYGLALFAVLP